MDALTVFLVALGTAFATGLGVLPLVVFKSRSERWVAVSNALAAGFMIGASFGLLYEGGTIHVAKTIVGAIVGGLFVGGSRALIGEQEARIGDLRGADAKKALLVIGVMTVHSITEGVGIGVAFADSDSLGALIAIAIAMHNIPEGLAIGLVLIPSGVPSREAAGWAIFSSLPQPVMAVPAFLGVEIVDTLLPAGLGFAAGAMMWLSVAYMIPDAAKGAPLRVVTGSVIGGAAVMLILSALLAF
jgi:zinc transporter, ZIP family